MPGALLLSGDAPYGWVTPFTSLRLGNNAGNGVAFIGGVIVLTFDLGSLFSANFSIVQWNGNNWELRYSWIHPAGGSGSYTVTQWSDGGYPEWALTHASGTGDPTITLRVGPHGASGNLVYYFNGSYLSLYNTGNPPSRIDTAYKTNRGIILQDFLAQGCID